MNKPTPFAVINNLKSSEILKAFWKDLKSLGYLPCENHNKKFSPDNEFLYENGLCVNVNHKDYITSDKFLEIAAIKASHKRQVFHLPEEYAQALEFAKEQIKKLDSILNKKNKFNSITFTYIIFNDKLSIFKDDYIIPLDSIDFDTYQTFKTLNSDFKNTNLYYEKIHTIKFSYKEATAHQLYEYFSKFIDKITDQISIDWFKEILIVDETEIPFDSIFNYDHNLIVPNSDIKINAKYVLEGDYKIIHSKGTTIITYQTFENQWYRKAKAIKQLLKQLQTNK